MSKNRRYSSQTRLFPLNIVLPPSPGYGVAGWYADALRILNGMVRTLEKQLPETDNPFPPRYHL